MQQNIEIKNKKAGFQYQITDKYTAGIGLTGTEVKSVREGKATINEAYCFFRKGELYIKNMHITEYQKGTHYNHEPTRTRKLLLKKRELKKLEAKVKEKGLTIIPILLFFSDTGYVKIEVGLAKGKKSFDKRESIKRKDIKRETERILKGRH